MTRVTILKTQLTKQGGAEKYARCLADAFCKRECDVSVLTTGSVEGVYPYTVTSCNLRSKTSVSKLWEFEAFCQDQLTKHPSEIILSLDRNRFQTHVRASSGVHKAYLHHRRRFEPRWKQLRHLFNPLHTSLLHMEKVAFENPDLKGIFTNSHLVKEEILSHFVVDPNRLHVVHNGVEWHEYQNAFDTWQDNYLSNAFEFLFIGSGFARKGLDRLLSGLRRISDRDIHLSVVGGDKNLKRYVRQCANYPVTFYGPTRDILPFLQKADCLVISSHYDPFANVTVEALAMGLFVVSSRYNGGAEIITPQSGTIIEDLYDDASVQETLLHAVNHPKTAKSAELIRKSVEHLDFSSQLATYIDLCLPSTS